MKESTENVFKSPKFCYQQGNWGQGIESWCQNYYRKLLRPTSHLRFYRAILSRNFIERQNCMCDTPCLTLQLCRINKNWPTAFTRIFATKLHRIERSSIRKRSCATAKKLRDKVARQNRARKLQVWRRSKHRRRNGFKSEGAHLFRREAPENFIKSAPPLLACAPLWGGHSWERRGHIRAQHHASSHILQHLF